MTNEVETRPSMICDSFVYGDAEHAHYEQHGYYIFDRFLTDDALDRCRRHIDRMVGEIHSRCTPEEMICPHQQGERWVWELGTEPKLLDMIERHIGPNILLWASHALVKPPHTGIEVRWHQDAPYWNVAGPLAGAVWITLDDVDEENGTMSILPGLHTRGELPRLADRTDGDESGHDRLFKQEIDLDSSIPGDLPDVALAGDGLRQVILNLLLNAIEVTPSGGTVALRASAADGFVEFSVADGGPGVPLELRETVFEPFYSTRSESAGGLGLAITRRIVSDAGGTIRAESRERGGATFRVRLPRSESHA